MQTPQLLDGVTGEYTKLTEDELANLNIVLGAYRSFRGDRRAHVAYVGMPITTGKRYYEVLSEHGAKNQEELAAKLGRTAVWDLIIKPNIAEGIAFADALGRQKSLIFIAPSVFEAKRWRWTQDAYMSLWYRVIGELAGAHFVMDGWEYSTGGMKEVLFSMFMRWAIIRPYTKDIAVETFGLRNFHPGMTPQEEREEFEAMRKIRVYDAAGGEIPIDVALAKSIKAIYDLKDRGFPYQDLLEPAWRLMQTPILSPMANIWDPTSLYLESRARLQQLVNAKGI